MIKPGFFNTYYKLTKPGIIRGNLITAAAGFFLASHGKFNSGLFLAMLAGLVLVVASGCVLNNLLDKNIDQKMERTKGRAIASGKVSAFTAFVYAVILALTGSVLLAVTTNKLTLGLALAGLFSYVVVYGIAKRLTSYGTIIGSVSGAVPPLVGYSAVSGDLDFAALILFIILVLWQMPHFYSIALYRLADYKRAGLPVLPLVKGTDTTKKRILLYIQAYLFATLALSVFGFTGYVYFGVAAILGTIWLSIGISELKTKDDKRWAKSMFRFSLLSLSLLCVTIYFDGFLP